MKEFTIKDIEKLTWCRHYPECFQMLKIAWKEESLTFHAIYELPIGPDPYWNYEIKLDVLSRLASLDNLKEWSNWCAKESQKYEDLAISRNYRSSIIEEIREYNNLTKSSLEGVCGTDAASFATYVVWSTTDAHAVIYGRGNKATIHKETMRMLEVLVNLESKEDS